MPEGCDQKLDVFPTILTFYPTPFPPQTIPLLVDTFYINHSLGRGPPPTHFETCKIHLFGLGMPCFQKSAVFLNIVQKAFDPPPPFI